MVITTVNGISNSCAMYRSMIFKESLPLLEAGTYDYRMSPGARLTLG
jgi:hypothetical protein